MEACAALVVTAPDATTAAPLHPALTPLPLRPAQQENSSVAKNIMEQTFKDDHDRLRVMIDAYLAMLRGNARPDIAEVMRRRLAFSNAFRAHVAAEGPALDALRTGNGDHPVDRMLDRHGARLREVMPGYSALIHDWTPPRIVAEWPSYCREVRAQVRRYYEFLAWEEAQVLPLLDQPVSASCRATSSG